MPSLYNRRKAKALSERSRAMALARWAKDRQRRESEIPAIAREIAEAEVANLPRKEGDPLGCLQWTDFRTGKVRRWVVRIGDRRDRITVEAPGGGKSRSHGWTWFFLRLREAILGRRPGSMS